VTWKDEYLWWQWGGIYEIYIRSFQDTDGDGCGDLTGILRRLDYLEWLGVDVIWITPFYGHAVLTLPVLVPLSDLIGLSRQVTVLAYQSAPGSPTLAALFVLAADAIGAGVGVGV
jgi:hypothetical protein